MKPRPIVYGKPVHDNRVIAKWLWKFIYSWSGSWAIHSEPHVNSQRFFMSVLPGKKKNIQDYNDRQNLVNQMLKDGNLWRKLVLLFKNASLLKWQRIQRVIHILFNGRM